MIFQIPMIPPSPNVLRRKYRDPRAYKRLRESWTDSIAIACSSSAKMAELKRRGRGRVKVTVTIFHSGTRIYDPDNAVGAMKPVLDSLKAVQYIRDDSQDWIDLEVKQERSRRAGTQIELQHYELSAAGERG